jgi:hypothetical protein
LGRLLDFAYVDRFGECGAEAGEVSAAVGFGIEFANGKSPVVAAIIVLPARRQPAFIAMRITIVWGPEPVVLTKLLYELFDAMLINVFSFRRIARRLLMISRPGLKCQFA